MYKIYGEGYAGPQCELTQNASWMTQTIVVYVSGILHICDAAQLDEDDFSDVDIVKLLSSLIFDITSTLTLSKLHVSRDIPPVFTIAQVIIDDVTAFIIDFCAAYVYICPT